MERLILECAIRAALLVAATAIILLLLRVKDAATKHKVWTAVLLVMLALPAWTAWGPKAAVRILPPLPQPTPIATTIPTIQSATPDLPQLEVTVTPSTPAPAPTAPPTRWTWQTILLSIYLLGAAALLSRLAIGAARARQLLRHATLRDGQLTSAACAAPVTVGWFRPRVILPEDCRDWTQAKLDAVLTHEGEHARRRDPLFQALALLNRAIFWFHPAAWWLERRISTLAEEACDDVVLARGHSASDYSEYLMDMARAVMQSGARVNIAGLAMPGSSLPHRIKRIIEGVQAVPVSRARMACIAVACVLACAAFAAGKLDHTLGGDPMRAPQQQASGIPSPGADLPRFDSVSIAPRTSGPDLWVNSDYNQGLFSATVTLGGLLRGAYPLQQPQGGIRFIRGNPSPIGSTVGRATSIRGAPDWIDSARFDINARTESRPTPEQWRSMVKSLLADHFKLAVHYETDVVPVYGLVLSAPGKLGPQLRPHMSDGSGLSADGGCWDPAVDQPPSSVTGRQTVPYCGGYRIAGCDDLPGWCFSRDQTLEQLAASFTWLVDRPVLDQTGLSGRFDYDMVIDYRKPRGDRSTQLDYSKVSAALQQQLGLRLVPQNGPIEYLVIDHVEMPSVDQPAQASAAVPPEFNRPLTALDGTQISLAKYAGKIVLVNFWTTWSEPCQLQIPWFIEFEKKYGPQGLVVVGVAMDNEGKSVVQPYVETKRWNVDGAEERINYQVVLGNDALARQFGGVPGFPTTMLYGRDGSKINTIVGFVNRDNLTRTLDAVVTGQHPSVGAAQSSATAQVLQQPKRTSDSLFANTDSRKLLEIVATQAGLTITFDPNFVSRRVTPSAWTRHLPIALQTIQTDRDTGVRRVISNATTEQVLDAIALEANASWKRDTLTSIYVEDAQAAPSAARPSFDSISTPARTGTPQDAASPQFVESVLFDGNRRFGSQALASRIFTRVGDFYNDEMVRRDLMALWNAQYFDDIQLEVKESPNRPNAVVVIFHLRERPTIASLEYVGFTSVTRQEILEQFKKEKLDVSVESLLDPIKVRRAEDVLKALLAEHGHPSAVVRGGVATIPATNRVRLVFTVADADAAKAPAQIPVGEAKARIATYVLPESQEVAGTADIGFGIAHSGGDAKYIAVYGGAPVLVKAALEAIRQFRFTPLTEGDASIVAQMRLLVRFQADGKIDVLAVRPYGFDSFGDKGAPANTPNVPFAMIVERTP